MLFVVFFSRFQVYFLKIRQQKFSLQVSRNLLLLIVQRIEEIFMQLLETSLNKLQTQSFLLTFILPAFFLNSKPTRYFPHSWSIFCHKKYLVSYSDIQSRLFHLEQPSCKKIVKQQKTLAE
jgi:hypothetical protein